MTGSRTLETHAATSTHWANGRLHMAMGAQCLSGLGKWGPGHLALYQCQGVPGHPQTQVDRAKKIVENVLAQSLKDASNEALLS